MLIDIQRFFRSLEAKNVTDHVQFWFAEIDPYSASSWLTLGVPYFKITNINVLSKQKMSRAFK